MNHTERKPMTASTTQAPYSTLLSDYDYPLPGELIAQYPLAKRDDSRLMVINRATETIAHHHVHDLPSLLNTNDRLVLNNTTVLPCRVHGNRRGFTGMVEILFLRPNTTESLPNTWDVLMRPAKKLSPGTIIEIPNADGNLKVIARGETGKGVLQLEHSSHPTVESWLMANGKMPIPPYLSRDAEQSDTTAYQTTFAKAPDDPLLRAQAAPTAGLHFTPELFNSLTEKGITRSEVTLAVSSGTFREVTCDDITHHEMDPEYYTLPQGTADEINQTKQASGRIIAVGTTSAKTLESAARKHHVKRGDALQADSDWSQLFIHPPFDFNVVDGLLTNFHLPKSTLMMLVSAFSNRELMMHAYDVAVKEKYRFYSYGDAMLII
jgi:S-adenosylmethionine:tRNA ribosyltransferase-isomerase